MMHIPTRRLILLAILVLGSAGGAAVYVMRQPGPQASTPFESAALAPTSTAPSHPSAAASASPRTKTSASAPGPKAPKQQASHVPDSAVRAGTVFVDPAAVVASAPSWNSITPPTCGQWRNLLSGEQQTSYATALLHAALTNDGSSSIPPESTAVAYRSAITAACLGKGKADDDVSDVARAVYAADLGDWGP
jgi:hypothetical protein